MLMVAVTSSGGHSNFQISSFFYVNFNQNDMSTIVYTGEKFKYANGTFFLGATSFGGSSLTGSYLVGSSLDSSSLGGSGLFSSL